MQSFFISSNFPLIPKEKAYYQSYSVNDITCQAFNPSYFMASCDIRQSKLIGCNLNYSGNINYTEVNNALTYLNLESSLKFINTQPKRLSAHINPQSRIINPYSGLAKTPISLNSLCNSTGIRSIISLVSNKFMSLYDKRAYIHWFVCEGMESGEFGAKYEDLRALERDYVVLERNSSE
jgi:tubulin alpha